MFVNQRVINNFIVIIWIYMPQQSYHIRWSIVFFTAVIVGLLFFWETTHLKIETDILESMPHSDPVLNDARQVITHLPVQDRVFLDLEQAVPDRDKLAGAAGFVTRKLKESGLFSKVGVGDEASHFPELIAHVHNHLPSLLSQSDLEQRIQPLLQPEKIRQVMMQNRQSLEQLEGIGRAEMMAKDPLGFSGLILERLSVLLPSGGVQYHQGQLLSADGRHALIIARIKGSGTDSVRAAQIEKLLADCRKELALYDHSPNQYLLSSVGSYRAALDNETIARRDTRLAIILTTLVIGLLLILAFPRPLIGLLALLPSSVGAIAALFVCSWLFPSMSLLAVGFGGAIMAFTVDLGLTYLLFLDRSYATLGKQAAREVWLAELTAVMTTVGAFLTLLISDFRIMAQIGVFAALGVTFTFTFVHFVFPKIFPAMPPARSRTNRFLQSVVEKFAAPAKWKLAGAFGFALVMLIFAKPVFHVDLQAMNSVSPETLKAEKKIQEIWGNLSGKCYVLLEAPTIENLRQKDERLSAFLAEAMNQEKIKSAMLPSVLFPSDEAARRNFAAWQTFWTPGRLGALENALHDAAGENGFAVDAFDSFWKMMTSSGPVSSPIPKTYFDMLGIAKTADGFAQVTLVSVGSHYNAEEFFSFLHQNSLARLFDAGLFSRQLGNLLKSLFIKIALMVTIGIIALIFLFFLDWRLSLAVLLPSAFALCATMGTLRMIGHPLDIPGIMLWIVILGMGIDYALYYVCSYQRHPDENSPTIKTIQLSIFLSAATTFIGFGVLALAEHSLLRSIGLVSLAGIGYSLIGVYFILPTLMQKIFAPYPFPESDVLAGSQEHLRRTVLRYRHLPGYHRVFARLKILMDPMFRELHQYVKNPRRIIDIGCGYGVPSTWLLEIYPQAKVFGLEPDEERVLIANRVIGTRGYVETGAAPNLPFVEGRVDYALMLDMLHFLTAEEMRLVFDRIYRKLDEGGTLLIRTTIPSEIKVPWKRWLEVVRLKMTGIREHFHQENEITGLMTAAGFSAVVHPSCRSGVEEKWFVGKKVQVEN